MRDSLLVGETATKLPAPDVCGAFGLAAEPDLEMETLEPELAKAVGCGYLAHFLAWDGPAGISGRSKRSIYAMSD